MDRQVSAQTVKSEEGIVQCHGFHMSSGETALLSDVAQSLTPSNGHGYNR